MGTNKIAFWQTGDRVKVQQVTGYEIGTVRTKSRNPDKLLVVFDNEKQAWIDLKYCEPIPGKLITHN